jgi:hypothetical protein
MKICSKCNVEKEDSYFYKSVLIKKNSVCKMCMRIYAENNKDKICEYKDKYWNKNKNKINKNKAKRRASVSGILKYCYLHGNNYSSEECPFCVKIRVKNYKNEHKEEIKISNNLYRQENKDKINRYYKSRRENDPEYKIRRIVSSSVLIMIKSQGSYKKGSIKLFLAYTIQELKEHLEKQFESWMNWQNQGKYEVIKWNDNDPTTWKWQIDHIIPQSNLPYTSMSDDNFKKCWALENLRPLSAKQNLLDGANRVRHK